MIKKKTIGPKDQFPLSAQTTEGGREGSDHIAERGQTIDIKEPDEFTAHAEQRSLIA